MPYPENFPGLLRFGSESNSEQYHYNQD